MRCRFHQHRCTLTRSEYVWLNFQSDWFNKQYSALYHYIMKKKKVIAQKIIISTNGHAYTKIVMSYIKIKKLIIISVKKIHTESRPGNGTGYYLLLWKAICNLNSLETEPAVTVNSDHGNRILFDVCCILNSNLWPKPTSRVEAYIVQLNAFKNVKIATVAWTCSRYLQ